MPILGIKLPMKGICFFCIRHFATNVNKKKQKQVNFCKLWIRKKKRRIC